jgi:glycosyltransferase involved in cell wall biosynthesis
MRNINLLSIVFAYFNRRHLMISTLKSIVYYKGDYPIEIIIVDDGSSESEHIRPIADLFPMLNIKLITIPSKVPKWRVPSIAYNVGFSAAKGDVIMINSVDTVHAGDIIGYVFKNFDLKSYYSFSTVYGEPALNSVLRNLDWNDDKARKAALNVKKNWRLHGSLGTIIPFCGVINKADLDLLQGYDEIYTGGIGYDDHDFEDRIYNLGLKTAIISDLYCIHQYHSPVEYSNIRNIELLRGLRKTQPKRIKSQISKHYE